MSLDDGEKMKFWPIGLKTIGRTTDKTREKLFSKKVRAILAWCFLAAVIIVVGSIVVTTFNGKDPAKSQNLIKNKTKKENARIIKKIEKLPDKDSIKEDLDADNKTLNDRENTYIGKIRVIMSGLNLRDAPTRNSNVIDRLDKDVILFVISKENGWYEVTDEKEIKGYVSSGSQYVELIKE